MPHPSPLDQALWRIRMPAHCLDQALAPLPAVRAFLEDACRRARESESRDPPPDRAVSFDRALYIALCAYSTAPEGSTTTLDRVRWLLVELVSGVEDLANSDIGGHLDARVAAAICRRGRRVFNSLEKEKPASRERRAKG